MDKKANYSWMPALMPKVTAMVAERRTKFGAAHVAECFRRGMGGEPGWFFAREGAIAVGTPWSIDPKAVDLAAANVTAGQALLCMAEPEGAAS